MDGVLFTPSACTKVCNKSDGVFVVLDHLFSEVPRVKHLARAFSICVTHGQYYFHILVSQHCTGELATTIDRSPFLSATNRKN